ncbi:hypothetical protein [Actinomadura sp. CNU-125]|uniref:hypothetical protein n=1 Tax=Actinomadura sp. CNU-125 TaxID=1904961 RepID=UPI0013010A6B|nr:hypothetical protein [Actinomadura sp. CNU-125]
MHRTTTTLYRPAAPSLTRRAPRSLTASVPARASSRQEKVRLEIARLRAYTQNRA